MVKDEEALAYSLHIWLRLTSLTMDSDWGGSRVKSELAERLLQTLMGWSVDEFGTKVQRLQALAALKYDEYGGYRPGIRFTETLAVWLEQFESAEREIALGFVLEHLIFISNAEMNHLIEVAYPDYIETQLVRVAASALGLAEWRVGKVVDTPEFKSLRRRSLFLGLSDGARLDRLRRASPVLSHEQFHQSYMVDTYQLEASAAKLKSALAMTGLPGDPVFQQIWLVDDFAGSGRTLLRASNDSAPSFEGRFWRFNGRVKELVAKGIFSCDGTIRVLLYCASEQAIKHLDATMKQAGMERWSISVVQPVAERWRVDRTSPKMVQLCERYYDPTTADEHKADTPLGYAQCALPLILSHNAPNNSVCLLWAETSTEQNGLGRRALFPRYERHHRDRP